MTTNWAKRERKKLAKARHLARAALIRKSGGRCPPKPPTYSQRDFVLVKMGFGSYKEYLASSLWKSVRARAFALHGRRCFLCRSPAACLHHLEYSKAVLEGHALPMIVPVCELCHNQVEFDRDGKKRTLAQAALEYNRLACFWRS